MSKLYSMADFSNCSLSNYAILFVQGSVNWLKMISACLDDHPRIVISISHGAFVKSYVDVIFNSAHAGSNIQGCAAIALSLSPDGLIGSSLLQSLLVLLMFYCQLDKPFCHCSIDSLPWVQSAPVKLWFQMGRLLVGGYHPTHEL